MFVLKCFKKVNFIFNFNVRFLLFIYAAINDILKLLIKELKYIFLEVDMDKVNEILNSLSKGESGIILASELKDKIKDEDDIYLLDIRRKEDYDKGHLKDSTHCEWFNIRDMLEGDLLPKDKPIVTVCYSGQSSMQVATILNISGYKALSLLDGMNEWSGELTK